MHGLASRRLAGRGKRRRGKGRCGKSKRRGGARHFLQAFKTKHRVAPSFNLPPLTVFQLGSVSIVRSKRNNVTVHQSARCASHGNSIDKRPICAVQILHPPLGNRRSKGGRGSRGGRRGRGGSTTSFRRGHTSHNGTVRSGKGTKIFFTVDNNVTSSGISSNHGTRTGENQHGWYCRWNVRMITIWILPKKNET